MDFQYDETPYTGPENPLRAQEAQIALNCPVGKDFFTAGLTAQKMGSKLASVRERFPERVYRTKTVNENGVEGVRTWRFADMTPEQLAAKAALPKRGRKPKATEAVAPATQDAAPEVAPVPVEATAQLGEPVETHSLPGKRKGGSVYAA